MSFITERAHRAAIHAAELAAFVICPCVVAGQTPAPSTATFSAGTRALFALDLSSTPLGTFPQALESLNGKMSVVMKDGVRMLKATEPSEFVLRLPESLPDAFTIEFEITPKACCNPADLAFEGTRAVGRSPASMQIEWHPETVIAAGGGPNVQVPMPDELKLTVPSELTKVDVTFDGGNFKLFTNGKSVLELTSRKFAHGRVLRVSLGGQDTLKYAVYLSKLRIAAGGGVVATTGTGSTSSSGGATSGTSTGTTSTGTTSTGTTSTITTPTTTSSTPTSSTTTSSSTGSTTPVTAVLVAPTTTMTTATGMLVTPTSIKGPEQTYAVLSLGSPYPPGIVVAWTPVPNALSYRIYRMLSPTQPGVLRGTISASAAVQLTGGTALGVVDPEITGDYKTYQYWVQAVFADGRTSDPGVVTPVNVQNVQATNFFFTGLSASVGGTTTLFVGAQETRGSKVTWTWDATTVPVFLYFATIETFSATTSLAGSWTLIRSETIKTSAPPTLPYLTAATVTGPPYTLNVAAGAMVRFCLGVFPMTEVERQNNGNGGCVTSTLPP